MNTSDQRLGMMVSKRNTAGNGAARASGFTMVEMMMTVAIAAIVLMLAVPSFRYVTNANRIAAEINGLLGDLQFARAEAIKEGKSITVCVSSNGLTCLAGAGSTAWQNGWIVFSVSTATVLRVQQAFSGTDTFTSTLSAVTFNREGYAAPIATGTIFTLHDLTSNSAWTRCLTLSTVGQTATERANGGTCT